MARVGVIGLGNMGSALTNNLLRADMSLFVHDIRPEAGAPFIEKGAEWADSPAQLINEVDVVISMVFGPKEIAAVVRGDHGLLAGDCDGKVWIDLTTSDPSLMRKLAMEFCYGCFRCLSTVTIYLNDCNSYSSRITPTDIR